MGVERAIKRISKLMINKQNGLSEFNLLKDLDHPNVMKVYEAFEDSKNVFIVTELLNGGEIFDKLVSEGKFVESKCAKIMKQILYALSYCHDHQLAHRYYI